MDEKVLIKSERYTVKKVFTTMVIVGIVLSAILLLVNIPEHVRIYNFHSEEYFEHLTEGGCGYNGICYSCNLIKRYPNISSYLPSALFRWDWYFILPSITFALIGGLIYLWLRSYELTVTNRRVYGTVAWGKRVDLPIDSVSATATASKVKGITVSTGSGKISFLAIKNANNIYQVINHLLIERQRSQANATTTVVATTLPSDEVDQLKKYKGLLDDGVITQEEFDAKKKQLLDL